MATLARLLRALMVAFMRITSRRRQATKHLSLRLAQRLHDHAIDDALADLLHGEGTRLKVVAIMVAMAC